jgi:hypothetical protein
MFFARESDFDLGKLGPIEQLQWSWRGIQRDKFSLNVGHRWKHNYFPEKQLTISLRAWLAAVKSHAS